MISRSKAYAKMRRNYRNRPGINSILCSGEKLPRIPRRMWVAVVGHRMAVVPGSKSSTRCGALRAAYQKDPTVILL